MSGHLWLLYVVTTIIFILIPGPTIVNAINHGIHYPFSRSVFMVMAAVSACCLFIFVTTLGLGAVIASSYLLFMVIKIIGALYCNYSPKFF